MAISITIENLDAQLVERLRAEARRRGLDINAVAKELLQQGLVPMAKPSSAEPHHDLDALAGTWSAAEADAFLSVIADFERVDEDLWKA